MARIHMEDGDNTKIIRIQGNLSIQDSSALRGHLLEAFSITECVIIDLCKTDAIDLACMQVLCSAHKTFFKASKGIRIIGEVSEGVVKSLRSIALMPESCDIESHGPCLWATGGIHE